MALKGERRVVVDEIRYRCTSATERGVVLVYNGSGSDEVGPDNSGFLVVLPGTGSVSGLVPAGVLGNDMVTQDETRYPLNKYKLEGRTGGKCYMIKKGWLYTDKVKSGDTPSQGLPAYVAPSGELSTTSTNAAQVGTFGSRVDTDGFVLLNVDIK